MYCQGCKSHDGVVVDGICHMCRSNYFAMVETLAEQRARTRAFEAPTQTLARRYCLHVYTATRGAAFTNSVLPMWAFSAADCLTQHARATKYSASPQQMLRWVEPWRESAHGPWPEQLK